MLNYQRVPCCILRPWFWPNKLWQPPASGYWRSTVIWLTQHSSIGDSSLRARFVEPVGMSFEDIPSQARTTSFIMDFPINGTYQWALHEIWWDKEGCVFFVLGFMMIHDILTEKWNMCGKIANHYLIFLSITLVNHSFVELCLHIGIYPLDFHGILAATSMSSCDFPEIRHRGKSGRRP